MLGANTPSYGFYLGPTEGREFPFQNEEGTVSESTSSVGDETAASCVEIGANDDLGVANDDRERNDRTRRRPQHLLAIILPHTDTDQEKRLTYFVVTLLLLMTGLIIVAVTICAVSDICTRKSKD